MRSTRYLLTLTLTALLVLGCKSISDYRFEQGMKFYQQGNEDASLTYLVHALNDDPHHEKSKKKLPEIAEQACREHIDVAKGYEKARKYPQAVSAYDKALLTLYFVRTQSGFSLDLEPAKVLSDRNRAAQLAAEDFYSQGQAFLDQQKHKEAAICYRTSFGFVRGYKDAQHLYQQEKAKAMKTIAILPFVCRDRRFPTMVDNLTSQTIAKAMGRNPEFVELVDRTHLKHVLREQDFQGTDLVDPKTAVEKGRMAGVYALVIGKVLDLTAKDSGWVKTRFSRRKVENIYRDQKYVDRKGRKRTRQVKVGEKLHRATVTIHKRTTSSSITVSYQIIQVSTGKILHSDQMNKTATDSWTFGRYVGSEFALDYSDKSLCRLAQKNPMTNKELINDCVDHLSTVLAKSCVRYFY